MSRLVNKYDQNAVGSWLVTVLLFSTNCQLHFDHICWRDVTLMTYFAIFSVDVFSIDNWVTLWSVNSAYIFPNGEPWSVRVAIENTVNAGARVQFTERFIVPSCITVKSSKNVSIVVTNGENPDKSDISEKPPGRPDRGLKRGHVRGNPDVW